MSRKIKFPDSMIHHPNPSIRLAMDFLQEAVRDAKSGNVQEFLTHLSLAQTFASSVNYNNPSENIR